MQGELSNHRKGADITNSTGRIFSLLGSPSHAKRSPWARETAADETWTRPWPRQPHISMGENQQINVRIKKKKIKNKNFKGQKVRLRQEMPVQSICEAKVSVSRNELRNRRCGWNCWEDLWPGRPSSRRRRRGRRRRGRRREQPGAAGVPPEPEPAPRCLGNSLPRDKTPPPTAS